MVMQNFWTIWSLFVFFVPKFLANVVLKNDHWTSKHNKVLILHVIMIFGSRDFARQSATTSFYDSKNMP